MKLRLNKRTLADMPPPVRTLVTEWRNRWHKTHISVCTRTEFCPGEDAKVVMINLLTGVAVQQRVAGEWAGMTRLSPTDNIPLPEGCVAVVTGIFLGHPWLTVYQGAPGAVAKLNDEPLKLEGAMIACPAEPDPAPYKPIHPWGSDSLPSDA